MLGNNTILIHTYDHNVRMSLHRSTMYMKYYRRLSTLNKRPQSHIWSSYFTFVSGTVEKIECSVFELEYLQVLLPYMDECPLLH
ncbi:MAG: hypothetical protein Nkreftii_001046 [Candidatus Nitrospira kreftii]|uniref:Uncharacterized protein n=1 Tax=Candidatus Nitrospira kreftii TaxID=2652173 RepID=A0A7S8IXS1_9BACT|nr:MAG: hypothetical protein Nkreftii_001046 [Candidatus Nitrospira kreftii]